MASRDLIHRTPDRPSNARLLLATGSIAAGLIHAAVVPEHLEEAWVFGAFFLVVAGFQLAWAIPALARPSTIVFVGGAVANGALIGTWLVSRTIGIPIGPEPWMPEPAGALDFGATLLELLVVVGSLAALGPVSFAIRRSRRERAAQAP